MRRSWRAMVLLVGICLYAALHLEAANDRMAEQLRTLDPNVVVLGTVRQPPLTAMVSRDHNARLSEANQTDRTDWTAIQDRAGWELFREARLQALRDSLGVFPEAPRELKVHITRTLVSEGYHIDNLVVETRPGLLMTANLYRPAKPNASMPGILIVHSHHQPKHTGWRQDMAMTWARAGCVVIVPELVGHGERRQHPFPEVQPNDYHFRFDAGIQFSLIGDSLMGWFVWDLSRALDVLLKQPGVDARRIIAVSEPAGGGDVAAVAAALDPRFTATVINNFGGPQPESPYPLPRDAETSFEYSGRGSWESTRNLRHSARDGFLPWLIVASIAPRKLIYYHEFYWDREQDPVWKRLQTVWNWYDASDNLTGIAGRGFVVGSEPENTHWLAESRELLYPTFNKWFEIPNPGREYCKRRPVEDLLCITTELKPQLRAAHELAAQLGQERAAAAVEKLRRLTPGDRRTQLQQEWGALLGNVEPGTPRLHDAPIQRQSLGDVQVERLHLTIEPGIVAPSLLLLPPTTSSKLPPVVVGVCQRGKQAFLKQRSNEIAALLREGMAVCLTDVRGTGETTLGDARDRRSTATSVAAGELMLGESMLGEQLRDLRTLLRYLRGRPDIDGRRLALWGESFTSPNAEDANFEVPYTAAQRPLACEPLGGLLAVFGGLYEDDVRVIAVRGCLVDYQSLLDSPFTFVPFDAVVPGAIQVGDLPGLASTLVPRHLRIEGAVTGHNRYVSPDQLARTYAFTTATYKGEGQSSRLQIKPQPLPALVNWIAAGLRE